MTIRTCQYCKIKFESDNWRKVFCCQRHMYRYHSVKKVVYPEGLSDHERKLWYEIKNENDK